MSNQVEVLYSSRFKAAEALPPELFRRIVQSERRRTDRGGLACSVVCFYGLRDEVDDAVLQRIGRRLVRRVRRTDLVGWWDDSSLCVLLVDTGLEGALGFAATVTDLVREVHSSISFCLYSYPSRWFEEQASQPLYERAASGATASIHPYRPAAAPAPQADVAAGSAGT